MGRGFPIFIFFMVLVGVISVCTIVAIIRQRKIEKDKYATDDKCLLAFQKEKAKDKKGV